MNFDHPHFNGPEYKTENDHIRLSNQHDRIKNLMLDGEWRTLQEIADLTHDPVSSVSAQLRHLRKIRFGSYNVERQPRKNRNNGLFEYRLLKEDKNETVSKLKEKTKCHHCNGKGFIT